jgi:hypothetical protein
MSQPGRPMFWWSPIEDGRRGEAPRFTSHRPAAVPRLLEAEIGPVLASGVDLVRAELAVKGVPRELPQRRRLVARAYFEGRDPLGVTLALEAIRVESNRR